MIANSNPTLPDPPPPQSNKPITESNQQTSTIRQTGLQPVSSTLGTGMAGYGGGYGGYGSYGGMGYGSSLGSLGGYGSYGGYGGGYGGMYGGGYGRFGMMNRGENQDSTLMRSLGHLESFGFIINILGEISRNIEANAEGISRFYLSTKNLLIRLAVGSKDLLFESKQWGIQMLSWLKERLIAKLSGEGKGSGRDRARWLLKNLLLILALTLLPLLSRKKEY